MAIIALRFDFWREAAKAVARSLVRGSTAGIADGSSMGGRGSSLRQPLLGGPQCDRLETGVLATAPLVDGEAEADKQPAQDHNT